MVRDGGALAGAARGCAAVTGVRVLQVGQAVRRDAGVLRPYGKGTSGSSRSAVRDGVRLNRRGGADGLRRAGLRCCRVRSCGQPDP